MRYLMKRNCCLTPRQVIVAHVVAAVLPGTAGVIAAYYGYWLITVFVFIETCALVWATIRYAAIATESEQVSIEHGQVTVAVRLCGANNNCCIPAAWTRIEFPSSRGLVRLTYRDREIEVGRFLAASDRRELASVLRHACSLPSCCRST